MVGGSVNGLTSFRSALNGGDRSKETLAVVHKTLPRQEKNSNGKLGCGRVSKAVRCRVEVIFMAKGGCKDFEGIAYSKAAVLGGRFSR
jgi:hypothetical protein